MATYLVTGAAGYIASYLIPALLRKKHQVVAIDHLPCPENFKGLNEIVWKQFDLSRSDVLDEIFRQFTPGCCIHLAKPDSQALDQYTPEARIQAIYSSDFTSPAILSAVKNYLALMEAAIRYGKVPIVMGSSDSVYGPNMSARVCERSSLQPISAKGLMNFMMEQSSRYYSLRFGVDITIARFFNLYGPWRSGWQGDVISRFCQSMTQGDSLQLYGNGLQQRDFVFIEEAVKSLEQLIYADQRGCSAFNICTSQGVSIVQLISMIESVIPPDGRIECAAAIDFQSARPGDLHCAIGSNEKLFRKTGIKPELPLAEGIRRTLEGMGLSALRRLTV